MNKLIIEAGRGEKNYWRDVWRYRELFYFLAWRDILVRYKQTAVGIAWVLVRPFVTMMVLTIVFSRVAGLRSVGDVPYALLIMGGMLPWMFFSTSLQESSNSLINNANLVSKVYFPRLVVPAGSVITSFIDFGVTLALLVLMLVYFRFLPDWRVLALPVFTLMAFGAAIGSGLWFCALNVEYRDFRYIIPFVVQFGLYASPVAFVSERVPNKWRLLFSLNPIVGVIDGFRWCLFRGETEFWWPSFLISAGVISLMCVSGVWYFRRVERTFADVI